MLAGLVILNKENRRCWPQPASGPREQNKAAAAGRSRPAAACVNKTIAAPAPGGPTAGSYCFCSFGFFLFIRFLFVQTKRSDSDVNRVRPGPELTMF